MSALNRPFTAPLLAFLLLGAALPLPAAAAPSPLIQPGGRAELDLGLGIAHHDYGARDDTGVGLNLELKYGMGGGTEVGVRTGLRDDDGRGMSADAYGRMYDRETFGTGADTFANPEIRVRTAVTGAIALEGRAYVPFDGPFGMMLAVPVVLASGGLRLDSGVYVPIVFHDPTRTWISIPAQLWFTGGGSWDVGIISGARLDNHTDDWQIPLGVGLDRTMSGSADLLLWFLFPDLTRDDAAKTFGGGVGLRIRI